MPTPEEIIKGEYDDHLFVAATVQIMREKKNEDDLKKLAVKLRREKVSDRDLEALRIEYLHCLHLLREKSHE